MGKKSQSATRKWLSTQEAAEEIGVCERTLRAMRKNKKGPRFKLEGSRFLYDRDVIDAYNSGEPEARIQAPISP